MREKSWFEIENAEEFNSPALVLYPLRIKENIRRLLDKIKPEYLRPHVKTNKISEVCTLMMDSGIRKFKTATIAEAEMLAIIRAPDVLIAYQPVGPAVERIIRLIKKYPDTRFSFLADDAGNLQRISDLFEKASLIAEIFIDLNVGMNRTGILPENTAGLFREIGSMQAVKVKGIHAYDGHIRDRDEKIRTQNCLQAFLPVLAIKKELEQISGYTMTLIAGGTPTCFIHAAQGERECSPGTFVFWDKGYSEQLAEQPFEWAATLLCRVVSIPSPGMICVDLGYKSVAAENPQPRVYFLNAPEAIPVAHSEEHLVLKVPYESIFHPGDILYGVPWHICPTVALFDNALIVEKNQTKGFWQIIGRKREITL